MLEIKATLRVSSKVLTLEEITRSLGEPTSGFSIGEKFSYGKRSREFSYWAWELEAEVGVSLESHIAKLLDVVHGLEQGLVAIRDQAKIDVFCRLSSNNGQGGAVFPASLMQQMADYGVDCVLDLYMESEDDGA